MMALNFILAAIIANDEPVFPEEASIMVPSGLSLLFLMNSWIMAITIRSLILKEGLNISHLANIFTSLGLLK